jgi:hypothetical protein
MNRTLLFSAIRHAPFGGSLTRSQVDGVNVILEAWQEARSSGQGGGQSPPARAGVDSGDLRQLAYILATAFHETARTMQPIAEYGRGRGRAYGRPGPDGQAAYGRGFVQLTWRDNYLRADRALGLGGALARNFELALKPDLAAAIIVRGMAEGWFTGKKLSDYFSGEKSDWRNARRIVNGTDRAGLIAGYARAFHAALVKAAAAPASQGGSAAGAVETSPAGGRRPERAGWLAAVIALAAAALARTAAWLGVAWRRAR